MMQALLHALWCMTGAASVSESLQRWGAAEPAVARAVAGVIVSVGRSQVGMWRQSKETTQLRNLLFDVLGKHRDEDVHSFAHLALGFL